MRGNRYPKINIRSKRELARHLSNIKLRPNQALALINDVVSNFDKYWEDHPVHSQPKKGKWVRDASRTNLGRLLKVINAKVLKPHDKLVPDFIFGGLSGLNHKAAVQHLLGRKRRRVLLKLDITKFFEQISDERVYGFFNSKAGCGRKGARLLTSLCCVTYGAKNQPGTHKTIARGFSTSPRLAVWCNLDIFLKLERLVKKELKGSDPRIAIYVDDIGITASRVTKEDMMRLYPKVKKILEESDPNQKLPLNDSKTKIVYHSGETYDIGGNYLGKWCFELLGLQMNRNSVSLGTRTRWKLADLTHKIKKSKGKDQKLKQSRKATRQYKGYIER